MSTKGIIFSAPMVRALLAGTKTQTRRLVNPQPAWEPEKFEGFTFAAGWCWGPLSRFSAETFGEAMVSYMPYAPGDHLYVREAYYQFGHWEPMEGRSTKGGRQKWAFVPDSPEIRFDAPAEFRRGRHSADPTTPAWHARLARFMPKTASRLWLEVTEVRVQRLQDISEEDAAQEGALLPWTGTAGSACDDTRTACGEFSALWNTLHTEPGTRWEDNPWVCTVSFICHRGNVDEVGHG